MSFVARNCYAHVRWCVVQLIKVIFYKTAMKKLYKELTVLCSKATL